MRRLFRFLLTLSLFTGTQAFARAQTAASAEIALIDAANFPKISALVDVYDANGEFIAGLGPSDVIVYEDGREGKADTIRRSEVPVQAVIAINPGAPMAIRDSNGVSRYDRVIAALGQWAEAQPSDSADDLSLVSLSGSLINRANARDWSVSLNAFKPDLRNSTPNLQTLAIALDTVTAPTPQPGMKRAVLFVTPRMDDPNIDNAVAPFIQRAVDAKVRVFVWFVDAEEQNVSASANAFRMLAQQTGGAFFSFSRNEPFPDLNAYFAPLRNIYQITYTSSLTTAGDHTLGLYIETPQGTIPALDKTFSVNVQPPNPIFIAPPLQITRQPPADDPYNAESLEPSQQIIEIIVEFPDGHTRRLKRTTLYVDGQAVAEFSARAVVAVALLHHRGRAFFMGFDGDGHVAENVFVDAHLAFHLVDGDGRSVDVHQRVMRLAVLLDAVGEGLEAPVLNPADLAAERFDHTLVLFDESVDLLGGHVLAGQEYMFVKSHVAMPFLRFDYTRNRRQASTTVLKGQGPKQEKR